MPLNETSSREPSAPAQVVDVHAHLVPRSLLEKIEASGLQNVHVVPHGQERFAISIGGVETRVLHPLLVDVARRTEWMDQCGIDLQVVGTWADIFGYSLSGDEGVEWARLLNENLLEATLQSDRFEAFASLPMQSPGDAAEMIPSIVAAGFLGVTFAARIEEKELDDPVFEPIWAALSENEVPAFVHPGFGEGDKRTADYGMINAVGRPVDTTIAVARILGADIPRRFPGVKIILAHGGGAAPFILGRLSRNHELDPTTGDPVAGIRKMYFDTVVFDPDALCYLVAKASDNSVLLGSDYPFPIGDHSPGDVVESAKCLTDVQRAAITGGAAARLFGLGGSPL